MKKKSKLILIILFISVFLITLSIPNLIFADTRSDIEAFVTRFYNSCLDRDPDLPGLENWVGYLQSGELSGGDVAERFIFSEEFLAKNLSNEEFLNIMYWSFFGRNPDAEGYAGWLGQLNSGMSRKSVLARFVNSTEFANLCAKYGIQAGTVTVKNTRTAATAQGKDPKIVGSEAYYNLIAQALNILAQKDPEVYTQYASVSRIEERPFLNALGATYGSVVYMDLSKREFNEMPFEMEIACTLSHEFNHVTYWNYRSKYNKYIIEQWAFAQEYNTGLKVGAPAVYLNYISYMYYNVYLYYQRHVPRDFVLEPAA